MQLLDGGEHGKTESGTYRTFELNLIFNDAEKSRINLWGNRESVNMTVCDMKPLIPSRSKTLSKNSTPA